jgi:hypothetical protein
MLWFEVRDLDGIGMGLQTEGVWEVGSGETHMELCSYPSDWIYRLYILLYVCVRVVSTLLLYSLDVKAVGRFP